MRIFAGLVALLVLGTPSVADAAEGERIIALGLDYATWTVPQEIPGTQVDEVANRGGAFAIDGLYGWNDTLWLRASARAGLGRAQLGDEDHRLAWDAGATFGVRYAIDVLRYVPFVDLGLGVLLLGDAGDESAAQVDTTLEPVVELGLGLDVLESRTFSWGVVLRFDSFASQAVFFTAGARVAFRWGYF